jgi:hypothetical protein
VKGLWELPHHKLANQSFILTWVIFSSAATINYLTQAQYQELNNNHGWQQKSFENLRSSIGDHENFFTQYKMAADRRKLLWLCFMNNDGIGSSRLLLAPELTKGFPEGYYLALPDRSCGLLISKAISKKDLKELKSLIKGMYKGATTAMSGQLHTPSDFALPTQWTEPRDVEFSNILYNEILRLKLSDL